MSETYFNFDKKSTDLNAKRLEKYYKDDAHYIKKIEDIFATMNKGDKASVVYTGSIFKIIIERYNNG